jgi:PP-loop superfamily ATP-utilizing enzyme
MKIWLMVEEEEDHGTDVCTVQSAHATKEGAQRAAAAERADHDFIGEVEEDEDIEESDWCYCCRKDWTVDGPYEVNE